jgi:hypothetical protein
MIANRALRLLGHRVRRANIRQLLYAISIPVFKSCLYRRLLEKSGNEAPQFVPTDIWPGNANRGSVTVEGDFECLGTVIRDADKPWLASSVRVTGYVICALLAATPPGPEHANLLRDGLKPMGASGNDIRGNQR